MGVGRRLMRYVAMRKTYDLKESERKARERRAKPVSTM